MLELPNLTVRTPSAVAGYRRTQVHIGFGALPPLPVEPARQLFSDSFVLHESALASERDSLLISLCSQQPLALQSRNLGRNNCNAVAKIASLQLS